VKSILDAPTSAYAISFGLEKIDSLQIEQFKPFFATLPVDPYIKDGYRFRRLSHFQISGDKLTLLPHGYLFQSKDYNPLLGDIQRKFEELDKNLIALDEFKKLVFEFSDRINLKPGESIGVHQIRTTCSANNLGNPAPEGIHQDGADFIGIFAVDRHNIKGGETHLYTAKKEKPIFNKVLNSGELLILSDRDYFHFTSPIKPLSEETEGTRDVFVLTTPSLIHISNQ
jgi:hypothetical protein